MKKKKLLSLLMAAVMTAGALTGCGGQKKQEAITQEDPNKVPEDAYEINWYLMGNTLTDVASVEEKINEYLKDKINATVKINRLESSQYNKKLSTMIQTGEYFDIAFTANWCLNYRSNAANGAWFDLDPYIDTYMPKTKALLGEDILLNARVNGKLYAVPAMKEMAEQRGWLYRKDIAEKYNIDMDSIKSLDDLEPILKMIKEKEPDMQYPFDWKTDRTPEALIKYEQVAGPVVIFYDNDHYKGKAVNLVETPEYMQACVTAAHFYNEGLIKKDVSTASDYDQRWKDGKTFASIEFLKPGKAQETETSYGVPLAQAGVTQIWQENGAGTGSMMAISRTSKNPVRVMRFLELLNNDPVLNNLVNFGIEGKHYTKVNDKYISIPKDTPYTMQDSQWMTGNVFLNYLKTGEAEDKYEQMEKFNEKAVKPWNYGFQFDPEKVEMEIAACTTVMAEFRPQVILGSMNPEEIMPTYIQRLKEAGVDKVLEEVQNQLDTFMKNK